MMIRFYKITIIPYALFLLYMMFLGFGREPYEDHIVRLKPIFSTIEFGERSLLWNNLKMFLINVFGNLLMFVPFGFLGWLSPRYNDLKSLLIAFLSVLICLEALQYFTRLGVLDIDDILLNTVGVWLGFHLKNILEHSALKKIL